MNIFLSTPISQYKSKAELQAYKESLIHLISQLRKKHNVCTEIEAIYSETDYDTPEKSISKDLESVQKCDLFILHYPKQVPTSALIELGFALAYKKRILIIASYISTLPFLAQGIPLYCPNSVIIESRKIDLAVIKTIENIADNFA